MATKDTAHASADAVAHPGANLGATHGDDDAHAHYDPASGHDLPQHGRTLGEPRSPIWLPLVGVALFAVALLWWLSTPSEAQERAAAAEASASAAASASAPAPSATPVINAPSPPRPALPSGFVPSPAVLQKH